MHLAGGPLGVHARFQGGGSYESGKQGFVDRCKLFFIFDSDCIRSAFLVLAAKAEKAIKGSVEEKVGKANAAFDASKMGDMSDFDPANPIVPTGDTIKIAIVMSFLGTGGPERGSDLSQRPVGRP